MKKVLSLALAFCSLVFLATPAFAGSFELVPGFAGTAAVSVEKTVDFGKTLTYRFYAENGAVSTVQVLFNGVPAPVAENTELDKLDGMCMSNPDTAGCAFISVDDQSVEKTLVYEVSFDVNTLPYKNGKAEFGVNVLIDSDKPPKNIAHICETMFFFAEDQCALCGHSGGLVCSRCGAKKGDVDGDGVVTVGDARLVLRAAISFEVPTGCFDAKLADIDADGRITASDARTVLRVAIGLE